MFRPSSTDISMEATASRFNTVQTSTDQVGGGGGSGHIKMENKQQQKHRGKTDNSYTSSALQSLGIDAESINKILNDMIGSSESILNSISNYIIFARLIRNLVNQTIRDLDEKSIMATVSDADRPAVETSIRGLRKYHELISAITPINALGIERLVQHFVKVFQTGVVSLPAPFDKETRFSVKLLFLVYPNARAHVEDVINTIGAWTSDTTLIPEYNFLVNTLFVKVREIYSDPILQSMGQNSEFLKEMVSTLSAAESANGSDQSYGSEQTVCKNIVGVIYGAHDAVVESFSSENIDREILIKSTLIALIPLVKVLAESSLQDMVIWEAFKKLVAKDVLAMTLGDWMDLKNSLLEKSPVFTKLYSMCGDQLAVLLELCQTHNLLD